MQKSISNKAFNPNPNHTEHGPLLRFDREDVKSIIMRWNLLMFHDTSFCLCRQNDWRHEFLWEVLWDAAEVHESVNASGGTTRVYTSFQTLACHVIWSVWLLNPLLLRFHLFHPPNVSVFKCRSYLGNSENSRAVTFIYSTPRMFVQGIKIPFVCNIPPPLLHLASNPGSKWMSSGFSHHGWLSLSAALPPPRHTHTSSLLFFLQPMKENNMRMNRRGVLSAAVHSGAQTLSSVNSDIYWKHNVPPTADMQDFNLAGLIFIYLLEVCNKITINYIINDCINMHQVQDKIQIFFFSVCM